MDSIWTKSVELPHFQALEGDAQTDVLIIGGGMAGILCAYFLEKSGVDYILAERKTICSGITKNTTAKITAQHGLIYDKLLKSIGLEKAKLYLEANQKALQNYAELCKTIQCDFERKTAYVYSVDDRKKLEDEARALERIGLQTNIEEANKLPMHTAGAIGFEKQAQFNPLKFISRIASDLNIYENTFVQELKEDTAITDKGSITFKKLIFATHFPIDNKHGMYFLKMYQHRSYVMALENAPQVEGMYIDEAVGGMSFRNYKNFLLIGGGSHKTGKEGGNWNELRNFARLYYPNREEKYYWATQDCMTLDGIPYIGQYSRNMPRYHVATGFNKWGMTSSMVAAMILGDLILEKENPYTTVFNPSRSMIKPQLFINGGTAIANLLTFTEKRCPHLGCALKWNKDEHSWDCPCHGSRFDGSGRLLDNPANGDLIDKV
ncbi:FAD-dependent oxidoreductase [Bariatricus sp. SGI.154]|uniref:FAD-dependent oxidoreductase n=1 Tax=Bariatricus sp. SGI.154 TaxID=3420549 RepID=UPI003D00DAC1